MGNGRKGVVLISEDAYIVAMEIIVGDFSVHNQFPFVIEHLFGSFRSDGGRTIC